MKGQGRVGQGRMGWGKDRMEDRDRERERERECRHLYVFLVGHIETVIYRCWCGAPVFM